MEPEIGPDDEGEPSSLTGAGAGAENTAFAPVEPAPYAQDAPGAPFAQDAPPSTPYAQDAPGTPYAQDAPGTPYAQDARPTMAGQPMAPMAPMPPMQPPPPQQPMPPMPPMQPPGPGQPGNPYGYQPYGYPPYGYGVPTTPAGTNGLAIASLVLGIVGFFFITPIIGLILGLIALATVKRTGQRGKGLAISGVVLSSLWIALFATLIVVAVVTAPDPARRDAGGTVVSKGAVGIFSLHPKDCFTVPAGLIGSTDSQTRNITVVPCSTPHDSEAFGSFTADDSSYPQLDTLRPEAVSHCVQILTGYLPDTNSLPAGSRIQFIYGNQQAWDRGERKVECFIQFPAATLTASVQRDLSSYTADQQRFIQAVRPLGEAVTQLNATSDSAPLDVLQQRARDVANGMQSEITALTASPWPADAQPAIDALVAQHRDAAQLWAQAAGTDDGASFGDAVRKADAAFDMTDMQKARAALGLVGIAASGGQSDPNGSGSQTT